MMFSNVKYFVLTLVVSVLMFYFIIPQSDNFVKYLELILSLSAMSYFFIPSMIKVTKRQGGKVNFGLIFFGAMSIILIIGNISTHVIKFVFPAFDDDLYVTNIYWLCGMLFFSIGFIINLNRGVNRNHRYFPLRANIIFVLLSLSLIGTLVAFYYLGFIPFFGGSGTDERYSSYGTITLFNRLWSFCVVVAVFSFVYLKKIKSLVLIYVSLIVSILISFFFLIRMYPFLIFVVVFLSWFTFEENRGRVYIVTLISLVVFLVGNVFFQEYRTGDDTNALQSSGQLNFVQSKIVYDNFNEFGQLKRAINEYKAEPQYGLTLLSIPLGFLPAPFLAPFGIVKSDIQANNSAVLMAKWLESKNSTGIRIGILGEMYINFKLYGCLFMFFIGLLVRYLQNKVTVTLHSDWRFGFYMIFFGIALYTLVGQIDAIGSLFGNYVILFWILKVFSKKVSY